MFNRWSILLFLLAIMVCLVSCGQKVKDSVAPLNTSVQCPNSPAKQIVVLPLADYTMGVQPDDSLRRQVKIYEALMCRLAERGFYVPLKEDVVQYLVDLGVIRIVGQPSIRSGSSCGLITEELSSGWSEAMQVEIQKLVVMNEQLDKSKQRFELTRVGLDPGTIQQIGHRFGADYILRGRVVEYEVREGNTLNPLQIGILPFFFDMSSSLLFGFAESEQYDLWQDLYIGASIGALAGSFAETPFSSGNSDYAGLNAAVWGAAGASAAYLASKGGRIPQAVVQISLALQDASDGRIIWANRVEKQVEPVSMWADPAERTHVDRAVEEAAAALVDDLATALDGIPSERSVAVFDIQPKVFPTETEQSEAEDIDEPIEEIEMPDDDPVTWGS
jgi:TolB-like protein